MHEIRKAIEILRNVARSAEVGGFCHSFDSGITLTNRGFWVGTGGDDCTQSERGASQVEDAKRMEGAASTKGEVEASSPQVSGSEAEAASSPQVSGSEAEQEPEQELESVFSIPCGQPYDMAQWSLPLEGTQCDALSGSLSECESTYGVVEDDVQPACANGVVGNETPEQSAVDPTVGAGESQTDDRVGSGAMVDVDSA
ncbi:hypothetical protein BGX34_011012, partial [Mortierella sp. NVP85]